MVYSQTDYGQEDDDQPKDDDETSKDAIRDAPTHYSCPIGVNGDSKYEKRACDVAQME